jgi:hypothetical protein
VSDIPILIASSLLPAQASIRPALGVQFAVISRQARSTPTPNGCSSIVAVIAGSSRIGFAARCLARASGHWTELHVHWRRRTDERAELELAAGRIYPEHRNIVGILVSGIQKASRRI